MTTPEESDPPWASQAVWEANERREATASQNYDQAILTLSSGTLALSATFLHEIAKKPPLMAWTIYVSWVALVVAIVAVVFSFITSQEAHRAEMAERVSGLLARITSRLNYASGLGFIVGIVLFAWFALANL